MAIGNRGAVMMEDQIQLTEHPCTGCKDYYREMCDRASDKFPDCWVPDEIMTPLERRIS